MNVSPSGVPGAAYRFECFRLDVRERLLTRDGQPVALTPKAFDLLTYFVEHPGQLLEKSALLDGVWPGVTVEEGNLAFQVSTLRRVLDEGRAGGSLIQTVPTRGYRFVASVQADTPLPATDGEPPWTTPTGTGRRPAMPATTESETGAPPAGAWSRRDASDSPAAKREGPARLSRVGPALALAAALGVLAMAGLSLVRMRQRPEDPAAALEPVLTRLTANAAGDPVSSARVSPDGRLLAYADGAGVHVQFIDSGETRLIPDTRGMVVYAWSSDSARVRATACDEAECVGWDLPLVGTHRHQNGARWSPAESVSASTDGTRVIRTGDNRVLWADLLDGLPPREVLRSESLVWAPRWSLDGQHVLYVAEGQSAVRSIALAGGAPVTVFSADKGQGIEDVLALPGGRLVLALRRATTGGVRSSSEFSIQEFQIGSDGVARRLSRVIVPWRRDWMSGLSASADGGRVAFSSGATERRVYVAGYDDRAGLVGPPARLTRGEWEEAASAWTPDGRSVLFYSLRNDEGDIFSQQPGAASAEPLAAGPGAQYRPEPTGDGRWLLYAEEVQFARRPIMPTDKGIGQESRIMRLPLASGAPELIASLRSWAIPRCSLEGPCVLEELRNEDLVASELDPLRGIGRELGRWKSYAGFCLLPKGDAAANIVRDATGRWRVLRVDWFDRRPTREVEIAGVGSLVNLDPAADGQHFFSSTTGPSGRSILVLIGLDGTSRVLWAPEGMDAEFAVVSSDGTRIAMSGATPRSNVELAAMRVP